MRRADREIRDTEEIRALLEYGKVCRLGMSDDGQPYIVPVNYAYRWESETPELYFHSARTGRKIDIISKNNKVCIEIDREYGVVEADQACRYGFSYESLIGFGEVVFLEENKQKRQALSLLMTHMTGQAKDWDFPDKQLDCVTVGKIIIHELTGKKKTCSGSSQT